MTVWPLAGGTVFLKLFFLIQVLLKQKYAFDLQIWIFLYKHPERCYQNVNLASKLLEEAI